jgi:hypothetical protein
MFITNAATPAEILANLIMPTSASVGAEFKKLGHNNDLCPRFQNRAELILSSYSRHKASVDDIQGFTDQGVDVLLQYSDQDGVRRSVGLQIKSYREIEDDLKLESKNRTLIGSLHAQRTRAQSKHRVEMFYILLCGDGGLKHRDFVRRVQAEFTSIPDVRVITPGQAWSFFNLEDQDIVLYCMRILCKDDYVLQQARKAFDGDSDEYRRMMIGWVASQLEGDGELPIDRLVEYAAGGDDDRDRSEIKDLVVHKFLDRLNINGEIENIDGVLFKLISTEFEPIRALYFDVLVRHNLYKDDAIEYLWALTA